MKINNSRAFLRKHWLWLTGGVVFVVAIAYTLLSFLMWNNYQTTFLHWHSDLHKKIDAALSLPATNPQQRSDKLAALNNVSPDIKKAKQSLCSVPSLFHWQTLLLSQLKEREASCSHVVSNAVSYDTKQQELLTFLTDDTTLAKTLGTTAKSVKETDFEVQAQAWQTKYDAVTKQTTGEAFAPVKKEAEAKLVTVVSAWQDVVAASKAQNKVNYLAAEGKLARAYADLDAISATSTQQIESLVKVLQAAYDGVAG